MSDVIEAVYFEIDLIYSNCYVLNLMYEVAWLDFKIFSLVLNVRVTIRSGSRFIKNVRIFKEWSKMTFHTGN